MWMVQDGGKVSEKNTRNGYHKMQSPPRGKAKISFYTWQMSRLIDDGSRPKSQGKFCRLHNLPRFIAIRKLKRMMEDLHLVENRGSGVSAMLEAMRQANLEPPRFRDRRS